MKKQSKTIRYTPLVEVNQAKLNLGCNRQTTEAMLKVLRFKDFARFEVD